MGRLDTMRVISPFTASATVADSISSSALSITADERSSITLVTRRVCSSALLAACLYESRPATIGIMHIMRYEAIIFTNSLLVIAPASACLLSQQVLYHFVRFM